MWIRIGIVLIENPGTSTGLGEKSETKEGHPFFYEIENIRLLLYPEYFT
jgi:hypothetical protein